MPKRFNVFIVQDSVYALTQLVTQIAFIAFIAITSISASILELMSLNPHFRNQVCTVDLLRVKQMENSKPNPEDKVVWIGIQPLPTIYSAVKTG